MLTKFRRPLKNFLLNRSFLNTFSSNYYIDNEQYYKFLSTNQFSYNNQIVHGHPINSQLPKNGKTVVVVGGGVIGVSSALYLCQNTNHNVVLLEKLPEIAKETSNANGGIFGVEYNIIWVSKQIKSHYWNSLTQRDYPFKFKLRALLENHMIRWVFNMFLCILNDQKNLDKIDNLAKLSGKEFESLLKIIPKESFDVTAKGLLSLYDEMKDFKKKHDFYEKKVAKNFKIIEMDESEILKTEPILAESKEKFVKGVYWPIETNVETEKFTNAMLKYCQKKYQNRFQLLTETNAESFLLNTNKGDNEVFGVSTNKGIFY